MAPRERSGDVTWAMASMPCADGSDAFGYGNTAQNPLLPNNGPAFTSASANSPYRAFVAHDGSVYIADWAEAGANAFRLSPNLSTAVNLFTGFGGGPNYVAGNNHGAVGAVYIEGSSAGGNLVVYAMDQDLTTQRVTGSGSTTDSNSLWRYEINGAAIPYATMPTKISGPLIGSGFAITMDVARGADGKFYMSQFRSAGNEAGIFVSDAAGAVLWDSLSATQTLLNNPTAVDIFSSTLGLAVSPDDKWLAMMMNRSDVGLVPLIDGIPDIANRVIVKTTTTDTENTGRDIAFDAASNLHYVSSGQMRYRVLAPGGTTYATTAFNGTNYSFSVSPVPEPASLGLGAVAMCEMLAAARRLR